MHHAVPSGLALIGKNFVFQQDNDPKHTARVVKQYLENKRRDGSLTVLDWPAQSPDMNIIGASMDIHGAGESEESSCKPAAAVGGVAGHLEKHSSWLFLRQLHAVACVGVIGVFSFLIVALLCDEIILCMLGIQL